MLILFYSNFILQRFEEHAAMYNVVFRINGALRRVVFVQILGAQNIFTTLKRTL